MRVELLAVLFVVSGFAFAGCIEDGSPALNLEADMASVTDNTLLNAADCITAGGISVYPSSEDATIGPFKAKDMQPYIGNPVVGTYGMPIAPGTPSAGIWHMTTACDSYTYNGEDRGKFSMGWVAYMIEPPEFDTSGIERQYVVADLSFTDLEAVDALKLGTGIEVSTMFDGTVEWTAPNVFHSIVDEQNHGVFQTDATVEPFDVHESEPIRFWMLVAVGDDMHGHEEEDGLPIPIPERAASEDGAVRYLPIAIDIYDEMTTEGEKLAGPGHLSHTRNENHGNAVGANGNIHGLVETGDFTRTIKMGPQPQIYLEETWTH